jgi:hypothetical protein
MSDRELTRLEVLRDLDQRRLTTVAAAQLLALRSRKLLSPTAGRALRYAGGSAPARRPTTATEE